MSVNIFSRKPKSVIVLSSLLKGGQFEHEGRTWALSEDDQLITKVYKKTLYSLQNPEKEGEEGEEIWLNVDCSLQQFIQMAER